MLLDNSLPEFDVRTHHCAPSQQRFVGAKPSRYSEGGRGTSLFVVIHRAHRTVD